MTIIGSDPFDVLAYQEGLIGTPLQEGAGGGSDDLDVAQRAMRIGDVLPLVWGRRRGLVGGVLISPAATEARFENNIDNEMTASYHLVLSEGQLEGVQVRDVFQRSCRVGTFSQTYNRRAGPWTPGNFVVQQGSFTKPEAPYYTGTGGTYEGLTTGSYVIADVPDGDTRWDRQVHLFIRGGAQVTRLLDDVFGPSDSVADLMLWFLQRSSRLPAQMIDTDSLEAAAAFGEVNGLWFNGEIDQSTNLEDWFASTLRYFLLRKTKAGGKTGLRPLVPTDSNQLISTAPVVPVYAFDEDHIAPGAFEITFIPRSDRRPFVALMLWRQQPDDDIGLVRTSEVRYRGTAPDGPFEQHDLSEFATSEPHIVKVGAYLIARRRYITHTLKIRTKPGTFNATLVQGDVVRVRMLRTASSAAPGVHDFLYEVDRIGKARNGGVSLDLTHFPVDANGTSLVARDVVGATGGGILLSTGKTGTGCDVNSSTDETVPPDDSLDPSAWPLPGVGAFDISNTGTGIPGTLGLEPGFPATPGDVFDETPGFGDGLGGFGPGGGGGGGKNGNPDETLDDQDVAPVLGVPEEGPYIGGTLTAPNVCETTTIQWFRDGVQIGGASGPGYTLGVIDVGTGISARIFCLNGDEIDTDTVVAGTLDSPPIGDKIDFYVSYTEVECLDNGCISVDYGPTKANGLPIAYGTITSTTTDLGLQCIGRGVGPCPPNTEPSDPCFGLAACPATQTRVDAFVDGVLAVSALGEQSVPSIVSVVYT